MLKRISVLCIVLSLFGLVSASAATYYVWGGTGSDSNNGSAMTAGSAWATLSHADDVVGPGDIVYVKGNFSSQQRLDNGSRGNGTAGSPVTYKVYDDNNVNFTNSSGACNFFITGKRYVTINGKYGATRRMRFYNHTSGNGILAQGTGQNIDISGCVFNPSGTTWNGGYGNVQFAGSYTYIYVHDNEFRSDESRSKECIYIGSYQQRYSIDYVYIHSNTFILSGSTGVEAQALDHKAYGATHFYIYNNNIDSNIRSGFAPLSLAGPAQIYGNTIDISGQTSTDRNAFFYFFYDSGYSPSTATTHIYRNTLIGGCGSEAVWLVLNGWTGLRVNFYNNIVRNMSSTSGAYIFDVDKGSSAMSAAAVYHNTFYNCGLRGVLNNTNRSVAFSVKNNLFNNCSTYFLTDTSNMSSTWNGNYYYKSGASASTNLFTWNGTARSLSYLKSSAGQEANGVFGAASPSLDTSGRLTRSLPASINVSSEMSSWPDYRLDFGGVQRPSSWDVGAVQASASPVPQPPAAPRNLRFSQP